jgi:gliding motility-associated-like protein
LSAGNYSVTVTGADGCSTTHDYTVDDNVLQINLTGSATDILCFGQNSGAINLNISGGNTPYTLQWTPAIAGNPQNPQNLAPGDYSVLVTDVNGCSSTASFTIKSPASALGVACAQTSNVSVPGGNDGAAGVDISGGTAPYTVVWSPGGTQSNVPAGVFNINNLVEGNYAVAVTDANGCTINCDFFISSAVCETKLGTMSNTQLSICGSGCITATYNSLGQFLDADDVLQFVLHTGSSNKIVGEIARSSTPTFCFNAATMSYGTIYYVSAVAGDNDGSGNVNLADICTVVSLGTPIVFKQQPVASAIGPAPITCIVSQVGVSGSSTVPGSTFQWSASGGGTIVGSANQPSILAGSQGTYILIVNANGCLDTASAFVQDIKNQPTAVILANPDDVLDCTISEIILSGVVQGSANASTVWLSQGQIYSNNNPVAITQPGEYQFIVVDTITFCTDTANIEIGEDFAYPPMFLDTPPALSCKDTLVELSGGSPFPGIEFAWATVSGGDTTIIGTGTSVFVNAPGVYYLIGTDPNNSCKNYLTETVNANLATPTAEAGTGFVVSCFESETNVLDGSASFGSGGVSYQWTTVNGNLLSGVNTAKPFIDAAGTYVLTVTDLVNGCTDSDEVNITTDGPVAQTLVLQPPCFDDKGSIFVQGVSGGVPPYVYSFDNGENFSSENNLVNIDPGAYSIVVQDANGCESKILENVVQPVEFDIDIEPQVTVQLGESYQLETQLNVPVDEIASVWWTPSLGLSCIDCLDPILTPVESKVYKVTVKTINGCEDSGTILIKVETKGGVYVPSAFSPNNDGNNDKFMVFADPVSVLKVKSFLVFSRWGETVYQYYNFAPNDPAYGWDGNHRGEAMNPAVFTWFAEVEFVDGRVELFEGDVILMR